MAIAQVTLWVSTKRDREQHPAIWWYAGLFIGVMAACIGGILAGITEMFIGFDIHTRDNELYHQIGKQILVLRTLIFWAVSVAVLKVWKLSPDRQVPVAVVMVRQVPVVFLVGCILWYEYSHIGATGTVTGTFPFSAGLALCLQLVFRWPEYRRSTLWAATAVLGPSALVLAANFTFAPGRKEPGLLAAVSLLSGGLGVFSWAALMRSRPRNAGNIGAWSIYVIGHGLWLLLLLSALTFTMNF